MSGIIALFGGISARNEAKRQAGLQEEEARIAARNEILENEQRISQAKVAYLSSGLALTGSPMMFLGEQSSIGKQNVENIIRSGFAAADRTRAAGRAALMSGVGAFLNQAESAITAGAGGGLGGSPNPSAMRPATAPAPKPQPIRRRL